MERRWEEGRRTREKFCLKTQIKMSDSFKFIFVLLGGGTGVNLCITGWYLQQECKIRKSRGVSHSEARRAGQDHNNTTRTEKATVSNHFIYWFFISIWIYHLFSRLKQDPASACTIYCNQSLMSSQCPLTTARQCEASIQVSGLSSSSGVLLGHIGTHCLIMRGYVLFSDSCLSHTKATKHARNLRAFQAGHSALAWRRAPYRDTDCRRLPLCWLTTAPPPPI